MQNGIPLYTMDGELQDWISEKRMVWLERLELVRVVRHKKGHVARCILRQRGPGPKPIKLADYLGTRYSFRERLDNGLLCWRLRSLERN
jgi:hypothetical protein